LRGRSIVNIINLEKVIYNAHLTTMSDSGTKETFKEREEDDHGVYQGGGSDDEEEGPMKRRSEEEEEQEEQEEKEEVDVGTPERDEAATSHVYTAAADDIHSPQKVSSTRTHALVTGPLCCCAIINNIAHTFHIHNVQILFSSRISFGINKVRSYLILDMPHSKITTCN